jgi:diacylglycerol O-acyltransferase
MAGRGAPRTGIMNGGSTSTGAAHTGTANGGPAGSGTARTGIPVGGALDAGAPSLWREFSLGMIAFGIYSVIASVDWGGRAEFAQREGWRILELERALDIPFEEPLNAWLVPYPILRLLANYEYACTYIASALILLVWLYVRRPDTYRWARTSFLVMNAIALVCFALYPVAPPRLLVGSGFVDTVRLGRTWGSWGSPLVEHANQLAAMPSLHIAWAVWVSVVLACISGARSVQVISALHVLLTAVVVMATANHYLLDAVGGVVLVWLTVGLMNLAQDRPGRTAGPRVAAADAFFLYVESPRAPQHVGGLLIMDEVAGERPYRDLVRDRLEACLPRLPRFQQRLSTGSRWRRPRWLFTTDLDWDWHVAARDVSRPDGQPGGLEALHEMVADIQATPLPRDRPLWRFVVVTGAMHGQAAIILVMHHAVSDGIGTVAQATSIMEPVPPEVASRIEPPRGWRRAVGIVIGLVQLATDGGSRYRLTGGQGRDQGRDNVQSWDNVRARDKVQSRDKVRANGGDPRGDMSGGSFERRFSTIGLPLDLVRQVARDRRARVSDLLLAAVAGAIRQVRGEDSLPPAMRVSVPLMVRQPATAPEGNVTAAVMLDVPLAAMSDEQRLADTVKRSGRLYTGTRALASRFVISNACSILPPPMHAWFVRTVYGNRFFQAIISNMPGPAAVHAMAGAAVSQVYPILPLAPGAPIAIGALGWGPMLCVGICVDPTLIDDADKLAAAIRQVIEDLAEAEPSRPAASAGHPTPSVPAASAGHPTPSVPAASAGHPTPSVPATSIWGPTPTGNPG